ncbi:succinate dehydrogenase, hydrophobic membrane anchor protein [Pedomonas mirosovicensis]|uniref:succinate dehydrogenase, hydrophobic membrane anchor protein n=1 Tax=Pedomonas mirosovicensis TaxID=2908641 RepID=UPI00216A6C30|nr:succinate dehydrogenase, hydrophobic membrane anchor protein [Pedomonas mirosovicensis]MCH8684614.1 succinate dehydrogenase, hydrophobic membrane anchor protein [Pedomonas mirosovicensis]
MRTELGKVRGLGAAKSGTARWWMERVTSIALIPLTVWLLASLVSGVASSHTILTDWIANPLVAVLLILFIAVTFYHAAMGLKVVVEDYVHEHGGKITWLLLIDFLAIAGSLAGIVAVLKIAFGA